MKLINRYELMNLPSGTLYCTLNEPWVFGDMCIKGDTINVDGRNIDFGERGIQWVDADDSEEAVNRLDTMLEDSNRSYLVEQDYGREGMFDDNQVYMVYDGADIKSILDDLRNAYDV